jgi:hypothetical protein
MRAMDEIVLTIPRERPFHGVAHLVLGGLASRLKLTFERLEDLQLGIDSLLAQRGDGEITLRLRMDGESIEAEVGPFPGSLQAELEQEAASGVGLRRILGAVSDGYRLRESDGEAWVTLTKNVDGVA